MRLQESQEKYPKLSFAIFWKLSYLLIKWQVFALSGPYPLRIWWKVWIVAIGNEHCFLHSMSRVFGPWKQAQSFHVESFWSYLQVEFSLVNSFPWFFFHTLWPTDISKSLLSGPPVDVHKKLSWRRKPSTGVWILGHSFSQTDLNRTIWVQDIQRSFNKWLENSINVCYPSPHVLI